MKKKILSLTMALLLCLQLLPVGALAAAASETNLCEHHAAHDDACGAPTSAKPAQKRRNRTLRPQWRQQPKR